ncbi:MAG: Leucyl aminopeptidase [Frankiales bacterium]|nr:Leucyl aminopeptidase [Frankiales bacterium]
MTTLSLSSATPSSLKVDALIIGVAQGPNGLVLAGGTDSIAEALGSGLVPALEGLGATGAVEQVTTLATLGSSKAARIVAVGLGPVAMSYDAEVLRRATGAAVRSTAGAEKVGTTLAYGGGVPTDESLRAVAEGALLGAYAFTSFRSDASAASVKAPAAEIAMLVPVARSRDARKAAARAEAVISAVLLARDLVNTPPSHLHPVELAQIAVEHAERVGLEVEVLDVDALAEGGYGGILGVGQGSINPPRLVHLTHRGATGAGKKVALIGKGITFDSGGLSLKPPTAMEEMKSDMGGAAATLAAMTAVAELKLGVHVEAWIPMAENMPSGDAIRPSDVLTMRGGKRIEVNNTDAEGRLVLADAIARASEDSPDVIIDAATLTGAQLVALGARTAGVMSNDDALRASVVDAATRAGEAMWPMPLPAELRKGLDSDVADMVNTGPREGGMLTAGLFLQEFVGEGITWAHLDIAGPAFNSGDPYGYTPHGGTGAAVRTFVQLLEDLAGA